MQEKEIEKLIEDWFEKRRKLNIDLENLYSDISFFKSNINDHEYAYSIKKNKFLGFNIYKIILIMIIVGAFLYNYNPITKIKPKSQITSDNYVMFEKPDNKSKVIFNGEKYDTIKILSSTKYYHKVELISNNTTTIGFINKNFFNEQ